MNEAVKTMLDKYHCRSVNDYENAIKEIFQEIALLGLWRSKFFEKAAFYGGSALRILYGLDRFSEDLDFSLLKRDKAFSPEVYWNAVRDELSSFGFSVQVEKKDKKKKTNIDSAFIKGGTLENMIVIDLPEPVQKKIHPKKIIKIKIEVDIDPPGEFLTEAKYLFLPVPFSINTYILPHLFAGKMHAVLCRAWGQRIKGRDWYDLVWYVGRELPVGLKHLENRMKQSRDLEADETLTEKKLKQLLNEKIETTDFDNAKRDVEHLLKDTASLKLWSDDFFKAVCEKLSTVE